MRVLAFDPGKSNFAYAFGQDGAVEEFGFIEHVFDHLTDSVSEQAARLAQELLALTAKAKPDRIIAERYMFRPGMGAGGTGEFVNLALGILIAAVLPVPVQLIPSAQWKNHMTRQYWSKRPGSSQKKEKFECLELLDPTRTCRPGGRKKRLTTHEADAIGIALYAAEQDLKQSLLDRVRIV